MIQKTSTASIIGVLTRVQAAIVADGPWTGHDFCEPDDIGVCYENGAPVSESRQRELNAAMGVEGATNTDPSLWENSPNVQQIKQYIPDSATWDSMFPKRNEIYTFEAFL